MIAAGPASARVATEAAGRVYLGRRPTMPAHKTGRKLTRSHTTVTEKAREVVATLERLPEVAKISLGIIKQIGLGKPAVKYHPITGGFRCVVRGNVSIQDVWVYVRGGAAELLAVQAKIDALFV